MSVFLCDIPICLYINELVSIICCLLQLHWTVSYKQTVALKLVSYGVLCSPSILISYAIQLIYNAVIAKKHLYTYNSQCFYKAFLKSTAQSNFFSALCIIFAIFHPFCDIIAYM